MLCVALLALVCVYTFASQSTAADSAPEGFAAADLEFFEAKVRPLLIARCHECHSGAKLKGNLRLDSREGLINGGDTGAAIVPGKPDESLLIDAVRYGETYQMPPKGRLPAAEVAILEEWVRRGAPWTPSTATGTSEGTTEARPAAFDFETRAKHWCFQPLATVAPPPTRDAAWPRAEFDRFILAGLESQGIAPAPPAEKRAWLRRVTFDLTGLPPTPAEVAEFLVDESPQARERVVDRLLAAPAYGERLARQWLDLVRFAETYGHEHDFEIPNAYAYRDYLIRAFNADLPYDRLLVEHLAGDLVEPPRRHPQEHFNESIIGTAFYYFGEARHSPVDVREDEAVHVDNQLDVLGKTFFALTLGCARCHDHKFDAITQRDYYAMVGYLQSSRYQQAFLDDPADLQPTIDELARLRQRERDLLAEELQLRQRAVYELLLGTKANVGGESWSARLAASATNPHDVWHPWQVLTTEGDANGDFARRTVDMATTYNTAVADTAAQANENALALNGPGFGAWKATGAAFGSRFAEPGEIVGAAADAPGILLRLNANRAAHSGLLGGKLQGVLRSPTFTIDQPKIFYHLWGTGGQVRLIVDGLQLIQDPIYGGLKFGPKSASPYWHEQRVDKWIGHRAYIEILDEGDAWLALDRVVLGSQAPPGPQPNRLIAQLLAAPGVSSPQDLGRGYQQLFQECADWWTRLPATDAVNDPLATDRSELLNAILEMPIPASESFLAPLRGLGEERDKILAHVPAPRRALAMAEGTAENERLFIRGNHKTLGEEVPRRVLQVLGGLQHPAPADRSGRLELAEKLVDGTQPLVPRVIVNRIWQRHFGRGIVSTPDDFGVMGQLPTHPALLDWLAADFMRQGWSIKSLDRAIVLSSTYAMSSQPEAAAMAADPENRLWHHVPRRRLEAELIRDAVLAVSGRLDRQMYGPGVAPHLTAFMSGRGRPAQSGPLDGGGRRSIYLNVRRNFLSPLLLAFDYPTPFSTMGRRSVSNVPAQALVMLNNEFVAEQSALWGARIAAIPDASADTRIQQMFLEAFARPAEAAEVAEILSFVEATRAQQPSPEDRQVWTDVAHVLFNFKEFVFVD